MTRPRRCAGAGFTLLEVLVALVVMAVALGAGVRALGQAADVSAALEKRTLARWIAEDQAALMRAHGVVPDPGLQTGSATQGGRQYQWSANADDPPDSPFRRVSFDVREGSTETPVLAHLVIFMLKAPR